MNSPSENKVVVPETFEGWAMLHEYYRVDWPAFKRLSPSERHALVHEFENFLTRVNANPEKGSSACFSVLGHKGDILFLHCRENFEAANHVELQLKQTSLYAYLIPTTSYVSVVELGMYDFTMKLEKQLVAEGLAFDTEAWSFKWKSEMAQQRERIKSRLYTTIPEQKYLCFYPMNKKRGETVNWYTTPMQTRGKMMHEHGMIGRRYAGQVTQIISGSIGFDAWEWGVDLFSDDPMVFKKLVYEMRFDEASALYGEFGDFILSVRIPSQKLEAFFQGMLFSS